jgi:hypothetical protein
MFRRYNGLAVESICSLEQGQAQEAGRVGEPHSRSSGSVLRSLLGCPSSAAAASLGLGRSKRLAAAAALAPSAVFAAPLPATTAAAC